MLSLIHIYACYFVLDDKREAIYDRIDKRVDKMLQEGLVEEVKKLRERGCRRDMVSMQGLGYKEILGFLEDEYDLERAVYLIKSCLLYTSTVLRSVLE